MSVTVAPSTNRVIMAFFTKAGAISTVTGSPAYALYNSAGSSVASGSLTASGSYYPYTFNQAAGVYQLVVTTTDNDSDYPTWIEDIEAVAASGASAADVADAVLDEALSGHATSGTVGAALTAIKTKTDLIGAGDAVTVNSPVSTPQNIAITQGDDYLAADGREITLPFDGVPDLTGAVVVIRIEDSLTNFVGMYTSTSTTDDTATFQPSKTASAGNTATGALTTGVHNCEIEATLSGGAVWTLTRIEDGKLTVYRQANTS